MVIKFKTVGALTFQIKEEALMASFYKDLYTGEAKGQSCYHITLCTGHLPPPLHTPSLYLTTCHEEKVVVQYSTVYYIGRGM